MDAKSVSTKPPPVITFLPELVVVGTRFGSWQTITSAWRESRGRSAHRKVTVRCDCGTEKVAFYDNLTSGKSTACHACSTREHRWDGGATTPEWLRRRFTAAQNRCTSPGDHRWEYYGGRGIEFRFESVEAAARWMIDNCGLPRQSRRTQIDRIDNNGHYEPGNLRWASARTNICNRRNAVLPESWVFRQKEWPFSRKAVETKLRAGMTREQIFAEAHEYVRTKRNWWERVAARLARMTSSTPGPGDDSR